jgi:hypothetical protein
VRTKVRTVVVEWNVPFAAKLTSGSWLSESSQTPEYRKSGLESSTASAAAFSCACMKRTNGGRRRTCHIVRRHLAPTEPAPLARRKSHAQGRPMLLGAVEQGEGVCDGGCPSVESPVDRTAIVSGPLGRRPC